MVALPLIVEVYESHPISVGFDEIKRRLEKDIAELNCTETKGTELTEEESYVPWWRGGRVVMDKTRCIGNMYALHWQKEGLAEELHSIVVNNLMQDVRYNTIEEIVIEIPILNYKATSVVGMKT